MSKSPNILHRSATTYFPRRYRASLNFTSRKSQKLRLIPRFPLLPHIFSENTRHRLLSAPCGIREKQDKLFLCNPREIIHLKAGGFLQKPTLPKPMAAKRNSVPSVFSVVSVLNPQLFKNPAHPNGCPPTSIKTRAASRRCRPCHPVPFPLPFSSQHRLNEPRSILYILDIA